MYSFLLFFTPLFSLFSVSVQRMNVFNVIKSDRMVITAPALAALQQRLWKQYSHRGKKQAYANKLDAYLATVNVATSSSGRGTYPNTVNVTASA